MADEGPPRKKATPVARQKKVREPAARAPGSMIDGDLPAAHLAASNSRALMRLRAASAGLQNQPLVSQHFE